MSQTRRLVRIVCSKETSDDDLKAASLHVRHLGGLPHAQGTTDPHRAPVRHPVAMIMPTVRAVVHEREPALFAGSGTQAGTAEMARSA
jgi:hypothetical protein